MEEGLDILEYSLEYRGSSWNISKRIWYSQSRALRKQEEARWAAFLKLSRAAGAAWAEFLKPLRLGGKLQNFFVTLSIQSYTILIQRCTAV